MKKDWNLCFDHPHRAILPEAGGVARKKGFHVLFDEEGTTTIYIPQRRENDV